MISMNEEFGSPKGVLEWLISGNASARLLDFFVTNKEFDYSETDAAESSGVSLRTVSRELPKFESAGIVKFTRNVGRAKMYRLDQNSDIAKYLEQFVFATATKRIEASMKAPQTSSLSKKMETTRLSNR